MADRTDDCLAFTLASAEAEGEAIELDRAGRQQEAIAKYETCVKELSNAISACSGAHSEDKNNLEEHRREVLSRMAYLRNFNGNSQDAKPVEEFITPRQLNMQVPEKSAGHSTWKKIAAAAGIGAAASFVVLGGAVGATIAIVGGGAAAGYAATREDGIGSAARAVGGAGLAAGDRASELNKEHKITEKLTEASKNAMERAREFNEKYHITEKASAAASAAASKVQEIEEKHHVTDRIASGVASGVQSISDAMSSKGKGDAAIDDGGKSGG